MKDAAIEKTALAESGTQNHVRDLLEKRSGNEKQL
jgi:hypothetical protein